VHHGFSRGVHLLEGVQGHVVEVASAVQISLFVPHHLLKQVVFASFSLLLLQQQVVSRSDLIMFVVLDVCYCLVQITVWADA